MAYENVGTFIFKGTVSRKLRHMLLSYTSFESSFYTFDACFKT